jgi:hypothetical protein
MKSKIYKKLGFLYYKNFYNIKNTNFLYYKNNISKSLIKFINIVKARKNKIYLKFVNAINKFKIYIKKIKYKKFVIIKKENIINKFKIKRFNIYPKIFVKVKDQYKYLCDKVTVITNQSYNNNIFL